MARIYLALGTNLGDRMQNLREALRQVRESVRLTAVSRVYETEPWGVIDQPRFLNMALEGQTELTPEELLSFVKGIERSLGRERGVRYGPRVIDIDILLYDEVVIQADGLEIPHPRMAERRFVLVPLAEIAPGAVHSVLGKSVRELLAQLPDDGSVWAMGGLEDDGQVRLDQ
jgi:2-amino-4-hydroxy-6-hydroxymethyldihydropteridine diphosphokinase